MLNNLSNALIESTNTKLRVLHRMAFGFRQPEHLIALASLTAVATARPCPDGTTPQRRRLRRLAEAVWGASLLR